MQRLDADVILSVVLPIAAAAEIERSISAPRPPTVAAPTSAPPSVRMPVRSSSAWRPETLEPARGALASGLDALQALLAALADRDQLSLDLPAALDRQADGVGVGASGHDSGSLDGCARAGGEREAPAPVHREVIPAVLCDAGRRPLGAGSEPATDAA